MIITALCSNLNTKAHKKHLRKLERRRSICVDTVFSSKWSEQIQIIYTTLVFTIRVLSIAVVLFIVVFMNTKMSLSFIYSLILWILYLSLYLFTLFLIVIFNFKHTFRGEWFECTTCTGLMLAHNMVKMGLHVKILKNQSHIVSCFLSQSRSVPLWSNLKSGKGEGFTYIEFWKLKEGLKSGTTYTYEKLFLWLISSSL